MAHAQYSIGLKILLKKRDEFLFLTDYGGTYYDLPGGRMDENEKEVPIHTILTREICEELGTDIRYTIGDPLFQFRRHFTAKNINVFLTVYAGTFLGGTITLSSEHLAFDWINPAAPLDPKRFWCPEEYHAFSDYFQKIA